MKFKGRRLELEHGLKQIDIAPLIDVVFLLLIFFMLTSSFLIQPSIRVKLPKALTSEAVKNEFMEIIVTQDSSVYLNSSLVNADELKNLLKEAGKRNQSVLIKADKRASLGKVVEVWDTARDSGISQVNIATDE